VASEGIQGLHVETRNYGATAAFWASLGYKSTFETGHGSGRWVHPAGGPYAFIREQHDGDLVIRPVLRVPDATAFAPDREPDFAQRFAAQHWGVAEALIRDPDGRTVALEAPVPEGVTAADGPDRHEEAGG
jgi:hypothetical protein